jgi:hypothetical protein
MSILAAKKCRVRNVEKHRIWSNNHYAKHRKRMQAERRETYRLYRKAGFFYRTVNGKRQWILPT